MNGSIETGCAHVRGSKSGHASSASASASAPVASQQHAQSSLHVDHCCADHDHDRNHNHSSNVDADHPEKKYRRRRRRYNSGSVPCCSNSFLPAVVLYGLMTLGMMIYWWGSGYKLHHGKNQHAGTTDSDSRSFILKEKMDKSLESLWTYIQQQPTDDDVYSNDEHASLSLPQHEQQQHEQQREQQQLQKDPVIDKSLQPPVSSRRRSTLLGQLFTVSRRDPALTGITAREAVTAWQSELDWETRNNIHGGVRWLQPNLMPPLRFNKKRYEHETRKHDDPDADRDFFSVDRMDDPPMIWETEWKILKEQGIKGPPVDYTVREKYHYPDMLAEPPATGYPKLKSVKELMDIWPQDEDYAGTFTEELQHFDFTNPAEMQAALKFRNAELPFKVYNVPEVLAASEKWTDEYLSHNFKDQHGIKKLLQQFKPGMPKAVGYAQESANNFFAFFFKHRWDVQVFGLPPSRQNDWNFATWANHARFADAAPLAADQPHFYFQAGVPAEERDKPERQWCFISRDLPSFSSATETFFVFHPDKQKGIQCRFGERGVTAATHYDTGRNMIAMINGAKRYILSPPRECGSLGLFTKKKTSPVYRHSMLNFGHVSRLEDPDPVMSAKERGWLERVAASQAIDTVLKKGEVLYVPSHWFHYIISIQMSAQCNVRSGVDEEGTPEFGNRTDVLQCNAPDEKSR